MRPLGLLFFELRTAKELLAETLNLPDDGKADPKVTNADQGDGRRGKYWELCSGHAAFDAANTDVRDEMAERLVPEQGTSGLQEEI